MLKKIVYSFLPPLVLVIIMWIVKIYEVRAGIDFGLHGVLPRTINGLQGILFSPFLHGSYDHLASNSTPFILLMAALIFFYEEVWLPTFLIIYFLSGIGLWLGGRENYHIGASGVVYGLVGFIFLSGILRNDMKLKSLSMLVIFLYGSMIWGVFPLFKMVSYEAHIFGLLSGFLAALIYRDSGPKKKLYQWEKDEVEELIESEGGSSSSSSSIEAAKENLNPTINYIYTEKKKE